MIISKRYGKVRAKQINFDKAQRYTHGEPKLYEGTSENTTHVSAMDSDGNIVSTTQTQLLSFGSKVTTPGTGMLLNNCMVMFDPRPGKVNSPGPRARMLTSVGPVIILRDSEPFMCVGTPGGTRIWAAVCQAIVNVIDFGMTIQQAVEATRFWTMGIPDTDGENLLVEPGFLEETLDGLRVRGHEVRVVQRIAGCMNGILVDSVTGQMHGGACWRGEGTPMGISGV